MARKPRSQRGTNHRKIEQEERAVIGLRGEIRAMTRQYMIGAMRVPYAVRWDHLLPLIAALTDATGGAEQTERQVAEVLAWRSPERWDLLWDKVLHPLAAEASALRAAVVRKLHSRLKKLTRGKK